jgi:hypothetical protein
MSAIRTLNARDWEFSFNVEAWSHAGLWYCVVGDVSANDVDSLAELLKGAGS